EELPFGYFVLKQQSRGRPGKGQPDARPLGTLVAGSHHTLNPEMAPDGQTNFDPGEAEFGLWIKTRKQTVYSDVSQNRGKARRGIRLYPLRARNGAAIANAYLLAFADPLRG